MMNKKSIKLIIIMLVLGLSVSGCATGAATASSWAGFSLEEDKGYFAYGAQVYALDTKNGSLVWRYPSQKSNDRQFYAAPAIGEDLIVVGGYDYILAAVDKQNGNEKWQFSKADDRYIASAMIKDGLIYAPNSDHSLYVLTTAGDLVWSYQTEGPNWTSPNSDDAFIYLTSMDHNLYAFNFNYESSELEIDADGGRTLVTKPVWSVDLGAAVVADAVVEDGKLYAGTIDGTLFAVDLDEHAILWSFDADDSLTAIWSKPVIAGDVVFVGDDSGNLYAVSKEEGSALWPSPFAAGSAIIASGVAMQQKAVFATVDGKIFSIDSAKEPKTLATVNAVVYSSLGLTDEKIILAPASKEELFKAVDFNGNEIWDYLPAE